MGSLRVRYLTTSAILADALGRRLAAEPDMALAQDGPEADVVLVDGGGAPDDWSELGASPTGSRVVVIATSDAPGGAVAAARAGAWAWLDRRCGADDLVRVLRGVVRGGAFFPCDVQGEILESLRADAAGGRDAGPLARLTARESEVLDALGEGLGNREIAEYLDMSYNTVRTHINEVFRKLGVHTRVDAVRTLRGAG
ncbi:response regulator transcription factor [Actinomycetospora sp. TBRC 11914]|uniref:helix-turn-helix transcriptional regulator n=1 Tax=Actinomycetospora sp. TBRC 11914 TaxID=2729387 RepID=UPI00145F5845|nr:response regulator transcription factor [Actinomycetospora sp. TBRC 11914]NMO92395.1 response regulator transcription factor [Actinomycetospora sp. TBRC 11914]